MKKVLVAVPIFHSAYPEAVNSLMALAANWGALGAKGIADLTIAVIPRAQISEARAAAVDAARQDGSDELLFLDDDMIFPYDTYERLAAHDRDIVSVLAVKRQRPYPYVPMGWDEARGFHHMQNLPESGLVECVCTGCAGMLIKMSVFDKIPAPHFLFYKTPTSTISEDAWFCLQAQKAGIPVHVDCGLEVGHLENPNPVGRMENRAYARFVAQTADGPMMLLEQGEASGSRETNIEEHWAMGQKLFDSLPAIAERMGSSDGKQ